MLGLKLLFLLVTTTPQLPSNPMVDPKDNYEEPLDRGVYNIGAYIAYKQFSFQTRDLDDFIRISQQLIERYPGEAEPYFGLAEAWFISGKKNQGVEVLERLFKRDPELTVRIGNTLGFFEHWKEAVGFYQRYRKLKKSDAYFSQELIQGYQLTGDYKGATVEIVNLINRSPGLANQYERLLVSFLDTIDQKIVINEVKKIKSEQERSSIIARLYLKVKNYPAAAREFKKSGSKNELSDFARLCVEAGAYEPAAEIYNRLDLRLDEARCWRAIGKTEAAVAILSKDHSTPAQLELALVYQEDLKNPKQAENLYRAILKNEPDCAPAQSGLVKTYIELGELKKAKAVLAQVSAKTDWAFFYKIEIGFFEGEFDSIPGYTLVLSQQFPLSPLLNDGLELAVLSKETDPSLKDYSKALFHYESGGYEEGIAILKKIVNQESGLADDGYLLLARCYRAKKEAPSAIAALDELEKKFPESPVLARMGLERALIYREDLKDVKTARTVLEDLIVDYPDSPQACVARNLLLSLTKL